MRRAALLMALGAVAACASMRDRERAESDGVLDAGVVERTWRVRVYADRAYQAANADWEQRLRADLEGATAELRGRFGVTLQLVEALAWEPPPDGVPMEALVPALEDLDPGRDVDLVLGYSGVAELSNHDELGRARPFGHHAVVRGALAHPDGGAPQGPALERAGADLLLHQWGHLLGAQHDGPTNSAMNPMASEAHFTDLAALVIGLSLKHWGHFGEAQVRKAWSEQLAAWLRTPQAQRYSVQARQMIALVAQQGPDAPQDLWLGAKELQQVQLAQQADAAGRNAEAAQSFGALLAAHPDDARLHAMACQVAVHGPGDDEASLALCRKAAELNPAQGAVHLFVADCAQRRKDAPAAAASLARARQAFAKSKAVSPAQWIYLAELSRLAMDVSGAEDAAAHAADHKDAPGIVDWAHRTRRWTGLGIGLVERAREAEYVAAFLAIQKQLEQRKLSGAAELLVSFSSAFDRAVGPLTLKCELAFRRNDVAAARQECERALAQYDEAVHAQYLMGIMRFERRELDGAAKMFERVIALDASMVDAWPKLAAVFRVMRDEAKLHELAERYRKRFGKAPPRW